jgi:hypothetical protein
MFVPVQAGELVLLLIRIPHGFREPQPLIALAMLSLGGHTDLYRAGLNHGMGRRVPFRDVRLYFRGGRGRQGKRIEQTRSARSPGWMTWTSKRRSIRVWSRTGGTIPKGCATSSSPSGEHPGHACNGHLNGLKG